MPWKSVNYGITKKVIIMIPKAKILNLIAIYLYICDIYDSKLKTVCQRFSNNSNPEFTDQEVCMNFKF